MSNIKNPVPFYTLKQAAKELNRQLKTDAYDSKKILSLAMVYNLRLHILAYGWDSRGSYGHKINPNHLDSEIQSSGESRISVSSKLDKKLNFVSDNLLNELLSDGALLRLTDTAIQHIYTQSIADTGLDYWCFDGVLSIRESNLESFDPFIGANKRRRENISGDDDEYLELWNALESTSIHDIDLFTKEAVNHYLIPARSKTPSYVDEVTGESYYRPSITKKDVLITHKELEKIINGNLELFFPPIMRDSGYLHIHSKTRKQPLDKALASTSHLAIIGAMLSTFKNMKKEQRQSTVGFQENIIKRMLHDHPRVMGISESNLKKKFSDANTYLKQIVE
ncbi:MAG: hypothetical protein RSA22_05560 [Acinetobacter sp.]|jgi:hypothetical protein